MMEVVATTGAVRRAKLQSSHHHQQTSIQLFTGQMPNLSPNPTNSVRAMKGKHKYNIYTQRYSAGWSGRVCD